ncbi:MAG: NAD(P)H-hydrate dehydratase [Clostridia bacterium]|nr:NAD(P)H-hydrate dehydratase [Clostridia bacterium]
MLKEFRKYSYGEKELLNIPERPERSHKGTFGRLLVIGGSYGMSGAAYFSAHAAYRSGVGLVEIYSDEENRGILQTLIPEAIITGYSTETYDSGDLRVAIRRCDAISIGMGLGCSNTARTVLATVLQESRVPTVIDADALNLIAHDGELFRLMCERRDNAAGVIVTPHFGEMSRLCGVSISDIANDTVHIAKDFADRTGAVCLLKDRNTVVCEPGCDDIFINTSGCSGLATAGSGDVLAGIIGALCAYGVPSAEAARLGAYVHGLAGEVASAKLSEYSVMARDIIDSLTFVFRRAEIFRSEKGMPKR